MELVFSCLSDSGAENGYGGKRGLASVDSWVAVERVLRKAGYVIAWWRKLGNLVGFANCCCTLLC